jgi:hypothetical protein
MSEQDNLTEFQQQLMNAAMEIATRRSTWVVDIYHREESFTTQRLIEAEAKFRSLVERAADNKPMPGWIDR